MLATKTLAEEVLDLKQERRAVLLAHHYQEGEIQELADWVGDSLELARKARDFDVWTGMMSVDAKTKDQLRAMLADAPNRARFALCPEEKHGALRFYLDELLIRGTKP